MNRSWSNTVALLALWVLATPASSEEPAASDNSTVRVAAVQAQGRVIDFRLTPAEALAAVDENLVELERIVHRAGEAGCDALCFPEDTLGLLNWNGVHGADLAEVLPEAVRRMNERLGRAAAKHRMHLVTCSDFVESDGFVYNTAFLLGRDGREIGRYHKVCPPHHEARHRGSSFPVFDAPDLGTVGMLICYDLVMPETARCLALQGADLIFFPTMGGAAIGGGDIGEQALRVRAVENFVWLIVAHRGSGAMIISPQGKIVARAEGPDGLAIADVDPQGGREGGDAMNYQRDMRARLFRERNPAAFEMLTHPNPPALAKLPLEQSAEEAARISARVLTVGDEEFSAAAKLAADQKTAEAIEAFSRLRREYRGSWIDRRSAERLALLQTQLPTQATRENTAGIASEYPSDAGIEEDPRVLFVENFEAGSLDAVKKRWETASDEPTVSLAPDVPDGSGGSQSLLMTHIGGQGTGGQLYRRLQPGHDHVYARFYVKFDPDCAPIHHFGTCLGGNHPSTPWPQVRAGHRPGSDKAFWVGIEPFGKSWTWDYYAYWSEMRGSPPRGQTWGNSFIHDPELQVERGRWICVEAMIKMNDVGDANGELALWIDGKPVSHLGKGFPKGKWVFDKFLPGQGGDSVRWDDARGDREHFTTAAGGEPFDGFRWRTADELDVNFLWTYVYITTAPNGHVSKVWFDDIIVATDYIGPIKGNGLRAVP
jgi:predicted amidohydrolase